MSRMEEEYSLYEHFYELVSQIPKGKVATYGDIAKLADCRSARAVGFALNQLPEGSAIPWQRVINSQGRISIVNREYNAQIQADLLRSEGVEVSEDLKVNLDHYLWEGLHLVEIDDILSGQSLS